jgi:amino acid transporter
MFPFMILFFTGFIHPVYSAAEPHHGMNSLGMAIFTVMWNFIGWDNATTYANEVKQPVKTYLKAILLAFAAIYLFYLTLTYLAVRSRIPGAVFAEKGIPYLGTLIGGHSLGIMLAIGGMASMLGIFGAVLLSVSRVPAVMGKDKLLPEIFTRLHPKYQTPYISIIVCSAIVSLLILRPLADLLIMDICLYTAGVSLEFIALINLRKKASAAERPFRIPLQRRGLILLLLAPLLVFSVALGGALMGSAENRYAALYAILAIISAPVAWIFIKKRYQI